MSNCDFGIPLSEVTGEIRDCHLIVTDAQGNLVKMYNLCGMTIQPHSEGVQLCPGGIISLEALEALGLTPEILLEEVLACKNPPVELSGDVELNVAKFGTTSAEYCNIETGETCTIIYCLDGGVETYQEFGSTIKLTPAQFNAQYEKCTEKEYACAVLDTIINEGEVITPATILALAANEIFSDGTIGGAEGISMIKVVGKSKLTQFTTNDSVDTTPYNGTSQVTYGDGQNGQDAPPFNITVDKDCVHVLVTYYKCK